VPRDQREDACLVTGAEGKRYAANRCLSRKSQFLRFLSSGATQVLSLQSLVQKTRFSADLPSCSQLGLMTHSALMFLRPHQRTKDAKDHIYGSLVETVRTVDDPRQRTLCYWGRS
jgi:hypothetical protein